MFAFVVRRLLQAVIVMLTVAFLAFMLFSDTPCAAWTNCPKAKGRSRLNTGRIPVKFCLGLTPDPFDPDDFGIKFVT
jgi:ABC-type antimicrobial peptide transport system permease subunit